MFLTISRKKGPPGRGPQGMHFWTLEMWWLSCQWLECSHPFHQSVWSRVAPLRWWPLSRAWMKSLWIYERMNCDMFEWQKSPQCLELREQGGWRRVRRWSKEADGMGLGLIEPLREGKNLYLILASMPLIMWPL